MMPYMRLLSLLPFLPPLTEQGFVFINFDRDMRDSRSQEWARCRNSNLNEDLGKVRLCRLLQ